MVTIRKYYYWANWIQPHDFRLSTLLSAVVDYGQKAAGHTNKSTTVSYMDKAGEMFRGPIATALNYAYNIIINNKDPSIESLFATKRARNIYAAVQSEA